MLETKIKPYYQDLHNTLYNQDFRKNDLPDESVQCVVTSPPYWGLRKYSGEQELIWGGESKCEHNFNQPTMAIQGNNSMVRGKDEVDSGNFAIPKFKDTEMRQRREVVGNFCSLCGAWKGAYGLEPTPEMYIEHTIEILREIRRVLRKDGVVFWNIGDSYYGSGGDHKEGGKNDAGFRGDLMRGVQAKQARHNNLKPKDLCLIPFRVAIAAQDAGWWVRSVIIWSKNNPMPESVTDRPTESHEYILMLTKSGTSQYWTHRDHEGTRTQPKPDYRWIKRISNIRGLKTKGIQELSDQEQHHGQDIAPQTIIEEMDIKPEGWTPKNKMGWDRINLWRGHDYYWDADAVREPLPESSIKRYEHAVKTNEQFDPSRHKHIEGVQSPMEVLTRAAANVLASGGRNIRSVWEFPTQPYPEAHFAVFPEKLPGICIKAATPEVGCCSKCGAPWERVTETSPMIIRRSNRRNEMGMNYATGTPSSGTMLKPSETKTLGWQPTCKCNADKVPSIVLDPFAGAGTTLWVAKRLNKRAVGYEISEEYCQLALERNRQQVLL